MKQTGTNRIRFTDKMILIGIGLGALFWILESVMHVLVFHTGNLISEICTSDPNELWMRFLVVSILIAFGIYAQVIINQRKRAEVAARKSEAWLSGTLDSIGDAVMATDTNGCVTFMNPVAQALTGWIQKEAVGRPLREVFKIINEETGKPAKNPALKVLEKGSVICLPNNTVLIAKDGRKVPIDDSLAPIKHEKGKITGVVLAFRDITDRKKKSDELQKAYANLKKTQQELIQSEKLAALGRFSSGIAHEIKNPLGIILGGSEFLEMKLSRVGSDVKTAINKIKESTFRANTIVQDLLKFSRPSALKTERINPNDLIRETLSLFKYRTPLIEIKIKTHFAKEKMYLEVDKNQMQQVLFNLLLNALESMPKGGSIIIKTYKMAPSESSLGDKHCVIEVTDTGEGISKKDLERIFEPFFTTKRERKGTGLGLSMTKMIVNNHKGDLAIESIPGEGTTAQIVLPFH